jgi:hypothetical protein
MKIVGREMMNVLHLHRKQLQQLKRKMKRLKMKQAPQKTA